MADTFTRDEILKAMAIRPCHITGMHEPNHHLKYVCSYQLQNSLERLLVLVGAGIEDLPRELHDDDCGWCHLPASQEKYRERQRASHRWAGAEIPKEMKKEGG